MLLLEMTERIDEALLQGRFVCSESFDVAGAFDSVPHSQLMKAIGRRRVEGRPRRVVRNWFKERTIQFKMETTSGVITSSILQISRGIPQGGVPFSLLRLIFFDQVGRALSDLRRENGDDPREF